MLARGLEVAFSVVLAGCSRPPAADPRLIPVESSSAYFGLTQRTLGSATYEFRVPPGATRLVVDFAAPLRGARVDAEAFAPSHAFPLLRDKRIGDAQAVIDWDVPEVRRVAVTVHYHLREQPVVKRWQLWGYGPGNGAPVGD